MPSFFCFLCYAVLHFSCFSLCTSVLRHLAVCNTAESVLCWCVLTTCIGGSSFLSTYSTNFVISTAWAASNCIKPLPPCFLGTYKRSTSAFRWCCPWMVSSFLVFRASFCSSSWCQLIITKLYLGTGTANDPIAWILLFALNYVPKTSLKLLKYSFFSFSFSSCAAYQKSLLYLNTIMLFSGPVL